MSCASHFVCKTELAAILGCSVSYLDRLRKKFGNRHERRIGPHSSVEINTTEWMKLWAENRKRGSVPLDSDEREFFGDNERWKQACWREKALRLQDERFQREGLLIPVEAVESMYAIQAGIIRGTGEYLGKHFGAEAQLALNESLDDCDAAIRKLVDDRYDWRAKLEGQSENGLLETVA
jgi:hypothetical protein